MAVLTLLGPQRHVTTVGPALECLAVDGSVAVITAGWQEREAEVDELREHVRRPVINLRLHERAEEVFQRRPEVFRALRQRQNRLKALQKLYRMRLDFTLDAARAVLWEEAPEDLLEPERISAIEAVRDLDEHHRGRLQKIHEDFEERWGEQIAEAVSEHRDELRELLGDAGALAVAGGHVAVLLNRLRLFEIRERLAEVESERGDPGLPIIAWSAGAMAIANQVVLFHDRPPQGAGNAEVLDLGLGLYSGVLPLPHARDRLRLEDPVRVSLFARRFGPAACVPMDSGAELRWDGQKWLPGPGVRRLGQDGTQIDMDEEAPAPTAPAGTSPEAAS